MNYKNLTKEQKVAAVAANLNPESWALAKQTEFYLKIIHKTLGKTRRIDRYAIPKRRNNKMNLETVTIKDCVENYNFKGKSTIINDGKIIGFQKEEIPTQTANPSGDE